MKKTTNGKKPKHRNDTKKTANGKKISQVDIFNKFPNKVNLRKKNPIRLSFWIFLVISVFHLNHIGVMYNIENRSK